MFKPCTGRSEMGAMHRRSGFGARKRRLAVARIGTVVATQVLLRRTLGKWDVALGEP
jgi:hypothetical protein